MGHLVDEAFHGEAVERRTNGAPGPAGNSALDWDIGGTKVADWVGNLDECPLNPASGDQLRY
jgi:hypothetical protein